MSSTPYRVELTETAQVCLDRLKSEDRSEVLGCLRRLALQPLPGPGSAVVRLRTSPPSRTPRFYVPTRKHGILFGLDGDLVQILVISDRPELG